MPELSEEEKELYLQMLCRVKEDFEKVKELYEHFHRVYHDIAHTATIAFGLEGLDAIPCKSDDKEQHEG